MECLQRESPLLLSLRRPQPANRLNPFEIFRNRLNPCRRYSIMNTQLTDLCRERERECVEEGKDKVKLTSASGGISTLLSQSQAPLPKETPPPPPADGSAATTSLLSFWRLIFCCKRACTMRTRPLQALLMLPHCCNDDMGVIFVRFEEKRQISNDEDIFVCFANRWYNQTHGRSHFAIESSLPWLFLV